MKHFYYPAIVPVTFLYIKILVEKTYDIIKICNQKADGFLYDLNFEGYNEAIGFTMMTFFLLIIDTFQTNKTSLKVSCSLGS